MVGTKATLSGGFKLVNIGPGTIAIPLVDLAIWEEATRPFLKKGTSMKVIDVDPRECIRWKFADRSGFEFGDIHGLAQDIAKNGQIEPVILRKSQDPRYKYEIIAGSRRWKACLEAGLPLKGIVHDLSDEGAIIAQVKENQKVEISDYSKGIHYSKILQEKKITITKLAESIGCSYAKLHNFLAFGHVPASIWDAVGNLSKVSSRTAATIHALSRKGKPYVDALIKEAEDIRKGIGSRTLERKIFKIVQADSKEPPRETISLPSGQVVAYWTKNGLQFTKDIPFDAKELEKIIVQYFEKTAKDSHS